MVRTLQDTFVGLNQVGSLLVALFRFVNEVLGYTKSPYSATL